MTTVPKISPSTSPSHEDHSPKETARCDHSLTISSINGLPVNVLVAEESLVQQMIIKRMETSNIHIDFAKDAMKQSRECEAILTR